MTLGGVRELGGGIGAPALVQTSAKFRRQT
jgi:hypothetical protein